MQNNWFFIIPQSGHINTHGINFLGILRYNLTIQF